MLKITEHTSTRLVLKDQRIVGALLAGLFTLFSLIALLLLVIQGIEIFSWRLENDGRLNAIQVMTFGMFVVFGMVFVILGLLTTLGFGLGVTFTLDKTDEVMQLRRMRLFRLHHETHSIYGISHLDVETNTDLQAYGLFLVLRSGERIPLAAISMLDQEHMERLVKQVRAFLRSY
jgi:L-cystine uptake protein TcyP (sodium:dicarboxylate symporter family)